MAIYAARLWTLLLSRREINFCIQEGILKKKWGIPAIAQWSVLMLVRSLILWVPLHP